MKDSPTRLRENSFVATTSRVFVQFFVFSRTQSTKIVKYFISYIFSTFLHVCTLSISVFLRLDSPGETSTTRHNCWPTFFFARLKFLRASAVSKKVRKPALILRSATKSTTYVPVFQRNSSESHYTTSKWTKRKGKKEISRGWRSTKGSDRTWQVENAFSREKEEKERERERGEQKSR